MDSDKMAMLKKHRALKEHSNSAKELTSQLMNLANIMGTDYHNALVEGMVDAMRREHRFIQQEFITALREALAKYGESGTDARNEMAVAWAKKAAEVI